MRKLLLAVIPLSSFATPIGAQNPQESLQAAVSDVMDWLSEGWELVPEMGEWGLVFGWFANDDKKSLSFAVTEGDTYMVAGGGSANATDLDICVYDARHEEIDCDILTDNFPLVQFRAESSGMYQAVLHAYQIEGASTYAGMVLLRLRR